jgi:hypothetical protein
MSQKLKLVPLVALATLAAAGCGNQSHTPSSPTPSSTASSSTTPAGARPHGLSALVAAADPICQRVATSTENANTTLRKVSDSTAKTLRVLARVAPSIASEEAKAVSALGALTQSGSQSETWHTMLVYMRALATKDAQLAAAAKAGNIRAVHSTVAGGSPIQRRLTALAERNGFVYCGHAN